MFVNANETFLTSFALDTLVNKIVVGVCEKRPVSSREVLELMSETLESSKMKLWYYGETVKSFNHSVDVLHRRGFSLQMTCPLYFRVPLEDGGVDELFPSGSQVAVTPNNYDMFQAMLKQYQSHRGSSTSGGAWSAAGGAVNSSDSTYYGAVRHLVPVSAQRNLLNAGFTPILKFMQEHLLNPQSPWYVRTEKEWAQFGVTYAVPFVGRLFAVDALKAVTAPVPFAEARRYTELANDTCKKLSNLLTTGAPLNAFRQVTSPPASSNPVEELDQPTPRRPAPPSGPQPPLPPVTPPATQATGSAAAASVEEWAEFASIGLRPETCHNMSSAEVSFWKYILRLRRAPSQIRDISFRLEFGGGNCIDLKANGPFIPVTKHNLEQFIEAAVAKQAEVHRYINGVSSAGTTTGNSVRGFGDKEAAVAPAVAAAAMPVVSERRAPTYPTTAAPAGAAAAASAAGSAIARAAITGPEGSVRVPTRPRARNGPADPAAAAATDQVPDSSPAWNSTRLTLDDLDSAVVRSILALRVLQSEGRLTPEELESQKLRFCLPCAEGVYNLIPNGRLIKVGLRNFGEFVQLLEEERHRLEAELRAGRSPASYARVEEPQPAVDEEANWTDKNILEIWTYELTTETLAKSDLRPEEVVQQTRLQWDTHFLSSSDDPQHLMSGPRNEIRPNHLKAYLQLLHRRLQSIRLAILAARQCTKQPSDVDSAELGESPPAAAGAAANARAVAQTSHPIPPQPTEEDLNMLSPTHNTGGLLAPPQSFNH